MSEYPYENSDLVEFEKKKAPKGEKEKIFPGVFGALIFTVPCIPLYLFIYSFNISGGPAAFATFFIITFGYRLFSRSSGTVKSTITCSVISLASVVTNALLSVYFIAGMRTYLSTKFLQVFEKPAESTFDLLPYFMSELLFGNTKYTSSFFKDLMISFACLMVPIVISLIFAVRAKKFYND